jgi:hypothetical protein
VLKKTPKILAKKLKYRPRNSKIKLISEKLTACMPAFVRPDNPRPRQTELPLMYTSWIKTSVRVYKP